MPGQTTNETSVADSASSWRLGLTDVFWILVLVVAGGLLWLPGLGARGLWTSGEARAAQVARRMVDHADYVTMRQQMREPHLTVAGTDGDDAVTYDPKGKTIVYDHAWRQAVWRRMSEGPLRPEVRYRQLISIHKPVFYYWLIAIAHRLGMEINNASVRCFSTVPAMCLLGVTYLLGCMLYERRVGLVAALMLATCVQFWWQARICQMDMLLALMMASVFLLWYAGDGSTRAGVRFAAFGGAYVLLAAASLMKSFAYMLLAGLIILVFMAVETIVQHPRGRRVRAFGRRIREAMKSMHFFAGLLVYLALVAPWFVLIHLETDGQYTRSMFLHHMFSRAGLAHVGREFEKKTEWWFYLARACVDMFPWVIMLPGAVVQVFRRRCRRTWRSGAYLLVWLVVWLVFFSGMRYRKNEYILPLYPPAMVLAAKMLIDFIRVQAADVRLARAIRLAFAGLAAGVVAAGGFALGLVNEGFLNWVVPKFGTNQNDEAALRALADLLAGHLAVTMIVLALLAAAMIVAAALVHIRRPGIALGLLTAGTVTVMLLATNVLMDRVMDPRRSQRLFAERIGPHARGLSRGRRLVLFGSEQQELVYLLPDRFDFVPWVDAVNPLNTVYALKSRLAAAAVPELVVMEREDWESILAANDYYARRRGQGDPWVDRFSKVPLALGDYNELHREPLVLLQFTPWPTAAAR